MKRSKNRQSPLKNTGTLNLAWEMLRRPAAAMDRLLAPGAALPAAFRIYAIVLAVTVLFYTFKPEGFPQIIKDTATMRFSGGVLFWAKVFSWSFLHTAVMAAMTGWYARLLKDGWLPLKFLYAVVSVFVPLMLMVIFLAKKEMGAGPVLLAWVLLVAALRPNFLKVEARVWKPLIALLMASNVVIVAGLPLTLAATAARSSPAYYALEFIKSFWILGLTAYGTRRITGIPIARAVFALIFTLLFTVLFFSSMYLFGVLPKSAVIALGAV